MVRDTDMAVDRFGFGLPKGLVFGEVKQAQLHMKHTTGNWVC